jgi:4-hydroxy-2-oxoglutarate aldolase
MKLQGMFAAVATPFDHTGALYRAKVQHNFEKWSRTSLAGFIIGAQAGEGPLLEPEEKVEMVRLAAQTAAKDRLLIADISRDGVLVAAKLARAVAEAGAHAVVSGVPHEYRNLIYGPSAQALFFRSLADQSPVPVLIYNAPLQTGVDVLPDVILQLAEHPNIAGVIECGTPVGRILQLRQNAPKDFQVLTGTESNLWEALRAGASGAVLPFASAAPYTTIALWEAFRTREEEAGIDWQARIAHPAILVTDVFGVAGLKHAMDLNGYYGGPPRLPFVPLTVEQRGEVEEAFRDLKG